MASEQKLLIPWWERPWLVKGAREGISPEIGGQHGTLKSVSSPRLTSYWPCEFRQVTQLLPFTSFFLCKLGVIIIVL